MVAITEDAIRRLAGYKGEGAPVTSCYLDVDGRRYVRHQDYEQELQRLLARASAKVHGAGSVAEDFRRIEDHVRAGIDRGHVRGLALFSCSADGFFETYHLPVPVRSQVVVNPVPAVRQLEEVVHGYEPIGVLLADRQRARVFVFELGELVEHSELVDDLPRDYDLRGERERGDTTAHSEALAAQHLRHAADVAFRTWQATNYHHLTIGAPDAIATTLESMLHPYLLDRLGPRLGVTVAAGTDEIRRAATAVEATIERSAEQALVAQLRDAVGAGHRAVMGLDGVLGALGEHRVDRLLVSHGFSADGWMCDGCGTLASVGRICSRCGDQMQPLDDVVEEAIEEAIAQSCRVDVCVDNADLDCLGRIGAFLRY
jgi:peptide subunit release factor 1 (eRF1)